MRYVKVKLELEMRHGFIDLAGNKFRVNLNWNEHYENWGGEYKGQSFFVIRRLNSSAGIGSNVWEFLKYLLYMKQNFPRYIPIIDLETYEQNIAECEGNAWELFFEQPNREGYDMEKIRNADHVLLSSAIDFQYDKCYPIDPLERPWTFQRFRKAHCDTIFNEFIRFQPTFRSELEKEWRSKFVGKRKILGILARGTDYIQLKPKMHPIPPTADELIEKAKDFLSRHEEYSHIYLCTEDINIYEKFSEAFSGGNLIVHEREYVDYRGGGINFNSFNHRENTKDYLHQVYLLSRCDSIIASQCGGTLLALLLNDGCYEVEDIVDKGVYE